jgi:hypothetical protein
MSLLSEWKASRERRHRAETYVAGRIAPPDAADIEWLSQLTGNIELATRELMYARRAIGLVVAERDALDDQTASDVAHALSAALESRDMRLIGTHTEWASRWRAYTDTLASRGNSDGPALRMARVLLKWAGVADPSEPILARAVEFIAADRASANEALRAAFGVATLPEDVRPSSLRS